MLPALVISAQDFCPMAWIKDLRFWIYDAFLCLHRKS